MSELVEFLRARLDEDEEAAHDADGARLFALSQSDHIVINDAGYLQHFTRDRALREVEAKRWAIREHPAKPARGTGPICDTCSNFDPSGLHEDDEPHPCPTLRLLALPYADHEDYRPEWAP